MLESCPRCSSRLGPPLKSGRQVCAECGWSSAPLRSQASPPPPPKSGLANILQICWRIIKRVVRLSIAWIQEKVQGYQQSRSQNSVKPGQVMANISNRLSALEQSIPTSPRTPWMMPEEAFIVLGGQPNNPQSVVRTLNGQAAVSFTRFQTLRSEREWQAFGFEIDTVRRETGKPWLRQI